MKEQNIGINILKFLAAILITNSHMSALYGPYSFLATGGAIGDALFFFISGFTLFVGSTPRFDNWYKKRIIRIYPSVLAWAILSCAIFGNNQNVVDSIVYGGGWFVTCIMLYYIAMYPIKKYLKGHLKVTLCILSLIILAVYLFGGYKVALYNGKPYFNFNWLLFFIYMLFGAIVGVNYKAYKYDGFVMNLLFLLGSVILFYGIQYICNADYIDSKYRICSAIPLFGIVYYAFKICNSQKLVNIYNNVICGKSIKFVGSLCLEIYIVQYTLFTTKMNDIFPLNILIMFVIIIISAYILRCCSRIICQTFRKEDYDWKSIFQTS